MYDGKTENEQDFWTLDFVPDTRTYNWPHSSKSINWLLLLNDAEEYNLQEMHVRFTRFNRTSCITLLFSFFQDLSIFYYLLF